jgi:hypothetical protein
MVDRSGKTPIGLETRTSILPTPDATPRGPGILGPDYSFADNLPLPGQVGVESGDSMDSVINAVKGVGYYVDMIGFGEASSGLTQGVGPGGGPRPLGVNIWMRTGLKCSNGAEMWTYQSGIPTGNALGKRIKDGLASAKLPMMRGLAPGIMEDAQSALDPTPIMKSVFGSGRPKCKFEKQLVGDQDGKIQNPATKAYYVENPETVTQEGGKSYQKRWTYDSDLTDEQWNNEEKTHCANGYLVDNHRDSNCKNPLESTAEGFRGRNLRSSSSSRSETSRIIGLATLALVGGYILYRKLMKRNA